MLSQNIEQIKHYNSNLANKILMFEIEKSNLQLAQNENGEFNLILEKTPLHSTISAIDEANKIAYDFVDNKDSIKIIYGLGLGYLPDSTSNKLKETKIIVYEPNIELIKFVFSIAQLELFSKDNVFLCTDKEEFKQCVLNLIQENTSLSISFLNSYKTLFLEDIKDTLNLALNIQAELNGNKNTFLKKAPSCFSNSLLNLKHIIRNPKISDLKDVYKGKTAIILCAGPSLNDDIELIKENQDKFVIFALNPTLKLLNKHKIKPNFIVAIENTDIVEQFCELKLDRSYLIMEAFSYHWILLNKFRKTFSYISNDNFFNYWIRDCLKLNDCLETKGTVSYTALMSAFIMGFEKIIITGQDLAYKDGLCYSRDCHFGELDCVFDEKEKQYKIIAKDFEKFSKAFKTAKTTPEKEIRLANKYLERLNKNICTVKSQDGKQLPSKTDYAIFIKCFEQAALELKKANPNLELINSSKGSAQIDGFENISLSEVIKGLEPVEKLNLDCHKGKFDPDYVLSKTKKLLEQLQNFQKLRDELVLVNEKIIKELQNKNIFTQNAQALMKKHTQIFSSILELSKEKDVDFIINVFLHRIKECFEMNYFSDIETAKKALEKINENFNRLEGVIKNGIKGLSNCQTFVLKEFFNV